MLKYLFLLFYICLIPFLANAQINHQKLIGTGSLHYLLWHVYDAKLYSDDGNFSFNKPFSLKLEYKRPLDGNEIALHSIEEIERLGFKDTLKLAKWRVEMEHIFPNVQDDQTITGIYQPNAPTIFYHNNNKIGTIKDTEFGQWFFKIWLDKETSNPALRKALLGQK